MAEPVSLDGVLDRIEAALSGLARTIDRRVDVDGAITNLEEELERLAADRQRLAGAVDAAMARAARLDTVNAEVSKRIVGAMETIRTVIEARG